LLFGVSENINYFLLFHFEKVSKLAFDESSYKTESFNKAESFNSVYEKDS
jgi:hypothetical protein